jgi:prepilin-type processing-associated H-X9-DG protein
MIEIHRFASDGVTVHSWAAQGVSPAWAIKDGKWYFALFPQEVVSAMNRNGGGTSILDNPQYQAVMKELDAPANLSNVEFVDLPRTVPATYQGILALSRVYLRMANISDVPEPETILPPLDKLLAECEPGGVVSWRDDAGFHTKAIMPFAGADATGNSMTLGTIGGTSLAVSILLPSLNRARETANRVKCASNMRQIGQGILLYSNDHQGAYPPDLGTLVKEEPLTAEVFVCPDSDTNVPHKMTPDQTRDWVNAHSDYFYLGAGLTQQTALGTTVVLYERDKAHGGDGMNILYGDGHVEFQRLANAKLQIDRSKQGIAQP